MSDNAVVIPMTKKTPGEAPPGGAKAGPPLKDLYELVAPVPGAEVLVDDRAVPYSRELWLPLLWFQLLD